MLGLNPVPEERRYLKARMELVVETLPSTIVLNPLWTAILFLPFFRASGLFGHVPVSHGLIAVGLHAVGSTLAALILLSVRRSTVGLGALRDRLVALQLFLSISWGAIIWLFCDGGTVNTIYVSMIFVTVVWAVVFTRASHP